MTNLFFKGDNWFTPEDNVSPSNGDFCVIVHKYGKVKTPTIVQYREADWLNTSHDYFLDISEYWSRMAYDAEDDWEPGFIYWGIIELWMPLDLPKDINRMLKDNLENYFNEE